MSCTDIYCRKKAKKRLTEKGLPEEDAKEVAEEVYKVVEESWRKYHGKTA